MKIKEIVLLLSLGLYCGLFSSNEECCFSSSPVRITIEHIEGNGIGYKEGYTSFNGFFTSTEPLGGI